MTINPKINPTIGSLGDDLKFDPKGDGKSGAGKKPAPKPKVSNGGKSIVFPADKITLKPKPNPMEKLFPKPKDPKPPKLEVIGSPAMDRLQ